MAQQNGSDSSPPSRSIAPKYPVPAARIVVVEHPCIVKNFDTGFKSLGGEAQLKHVLEHHVGDSKLSNKQNELPEPTAGVSLRPNDPFAKKLTSTGISTRNLLVKVTVPKRTGRKRKRGSNEPFFEHEGHNTDSTNVTAPALLERLRDNESRYQIEAMGLVRETHRFRTLPDFQMRSAGLPVMQELREHVLTPDYDKMAQFSVDLSAFAYRGEYPGPPNFTSYDMPHKYEYQQAPGVIYVQDDDGQIKSKNIAAPVKRVTWGLPPDIEEVPQHPPNELPRKNPGGEMLPRAVAALTEILEDRPLVTKRVALNSMPPISESIFKEATQYVGYSFKAGPWRDSLIKYGVDPRKDPKYRHYQTLMFQVDAHAFKDVAGNERPSWKQNETNTTWARPLRHTKDAPSTHVFDGKNITANGKTWQTIDVQDPVVYKLLQTDDLPTECDVYQWGWYHNGTMAKVRTIMKDKMRYLFAKQEPPHADYEVIARLPDKLSKANIKQAVLSPREYNNHCMLMATEVRNIVKSGDGQYSRSAKNMWERRSKGLSADNEDKDDSEGDNDPTGDLQDIDIGNGGEGDFEQDFRLDPALQATGGADNGD
ncbi:putative transcription factor IIIC subunit 5, HTH domain-containing protein [Septoria linicola]|nr:putative transcription factor IIIC subunit 5, HTH domain-containing protein [Septoria linicola]